MDYWLLLSFLCFMFGEKYTLIGSFAGFPSETTQTGVDGQLMSTVSYLRFSLKTPRAIFRLWCNTCCRHRYKCLIVLRNSSSSTILIGKWMGVI